MPDWTATASPGPLAYALSHEANLVAGLFGYPLTVGRAASEGTNKILWIAREPREGQPLHLTIRRTDGTGPTVTAEEPANSRPGEIYPSIVDVPAPGCWRIVAEWAGHTATLELAYA
jgi:hypothetical protein